MVTTTFEADVQAARQRVSDFDEIDGFPNRDLGVILAALEAGLRDTTNGAQYDAYVMLQDVVAQNGKGQ